MPLSVHDVIQSLPEPDDSSGEGPSSLLPVPVGRWQRLSLLGSLQAKVAAGYLFYWCRGWFKTAEAQKQALAEEHWRNAVRVLDSMSYMRGAVMKFGQTLGSLPMVIPKEFIDTLDQLHFNAPPMHWSLLREMVAGELGDDPENLFAEFDHQAFAAASLGQVHRAQLKTGEHVAVKIQYPGIAQTIKSDLQNLSLLLLPSTLSADWEMLKRQFDDLGQRLSQEADYQLEAAALSRLGRLFQSSDGVVVPRVYPELSSRRILTMEFIDGKPLDEFLKEGPFPSERNTVAQRIVRGHYRMWCAGREAYADYHPGNFLVLADGRVAFVDFGITLPLDDDLWEHFRKHDQAFSTGNRELLCASDRDWCQFRMEDADTEQVQLVNGFTEWLTRPRFTSGEYDFGDEADFRHGTELFMKIVKNRYVRAHTCTLVLCRVNWGLRALLHRMRATVNVAAIANEEVVHTGWDRSAYAPQL